MTFLAQKQRKNISVVLLHHPMTNREGAVVTTAVTNIDLHDISRTCRTYGIRHFFVVTPTDEQHHILGRILGYWNVGTTLKWHPDRADALSLIQLKHNFAEVREFLIGTYGPNLEVVMPDARPIANQVGYSQLREKWASQDDSNHAVIVLGTGWGVAPEFYSEVTTFLAPILGLDGYNHLSVRAAAAIILDRLLSGR